MSNAQDLLSILNGRRIASSGNPSNSAAPTPKSILNFKAGKMSTTRQPNGKYLVTPDARRGELHLLVDNNNGGLKVEWKDRRTKATVDTVHVANPQDATFERVETAKESDRVYLLTVDNSNNVTAAATTTQGRHFFWMQDRNEEEDEDICVKFNLYLSDAEEANKAAGITVSGGGNTDNNNASENAANNSGTMDNDQLLRIMQGALGGEQGRAMTAVPGNTSVPAAQPGQIDALGNILENLGVPQTNGTVPSGEHSTNTAPAAAATTGAATGGGLTLADLQGAMAGLATASPTTTTTDGPPLSELAAAEIIDESGILNDPDATARLIALLPENQRNNDALRDNLRSPQVSQCLQRLTAALSDDAASFNSIIANFQLDPRDGTEALSVMGNPIEAFLNCVLKDVEKKGGVKKKSEDEDGDGGESKEDDRMEEDGN
eukprot:scaffold34567_cov66-Cyclotella_meneghiniana.AAC.2